MGPEKHLQDQCIDYLKRRGIYHVNTHGNPFEPRGRPDLYICHRGRFIGCELKKNGRERPDSLQEKHLREITQNGGIGIWISSLTQLTELICSLDP